MPFMTIPEAAVLWHISVAELRQLCENHAILGAVRVHQRWFIPEDAADISALYDEKMPDATAACTRLLSEAGVCSPCRQ